MLYYLSLGSNIGEREQTLRQALNIMEQQIGTIMRCSSFYYSAPWGYESEHEFCNLCCSVQTELQPRQMLAATQNIERQLGREHKSVNRQYQDRTIDIDIIKAFDGETEIEEKEIEDLIEKEIEVTEIDGICIWIETMYKIKIDIIGWL